MSDAAILRQIGEFIKVKRVDLNLTQDEVADRAAISPSTLSLLERGDNIAVAKLLKVLRVLEALYVFDRFRVTEPISPLKLTKKDEKKRKRASRNNKENHKDDQGW